MANLDKISLMRQRSKAFIANLHNEVSNIAKELESTIVRMNQDQFDSHVDSNNDPLVHNLTGSSLLSPAYAKRTRKSRPDMNLSGNFRSKMFGIFDERKFTFGVSSMDEKIKFLPDNYNNLLGLIPNNLGTIQQRAGLRLHKSYKIKVNV